MENAVPTVLQHLGRRLQRATKFNGNLICKIDAKVPLNLTDLNQKFSMHCNSSTDWSYVLYFAAGSVVLVLIFFFVDWAPIWIDDWQEKRRRRELADKAAEQV